MVDVPAVHAAIDPAVLTEVVLRDLRRPDRSGLRVETWEVTAFAHQAVIEVTGGLFVVSGTATDEGPALPFSVVLKIVVDPRDWGQDPRSWAYWQREPLAFESGLLHDLPGGITVPRFLGSQRREDGSIWLWMEHVHETVSRPWTPADYGTAAHRLGRSNAGLHGRPLPAAEWLGSDFFTSIFAPGDWWSEHMDPGQPGSAWSEPIVRRHFEPYRDTVLGLWRAMPAWSAANRALPATLCHNDFHVNNLLLRDDAAGRTELVVLDWAFAGIGAVGNDLGELVAESAFGLHFEPAEVGRVEELAWQGYLDGLADGDWRGDPRTARMGYLTSTTLWITATLPGWASFNFGTAGTTDAQATFHRTADETVEAWIELIPFLFARMDEATDLSRELGLPSA